MARAKREIDGMKRARDAITKEMQSRPMSKKVDPVQGITELLESDSILSRCKKEERNKMQK